MNNIEETVKEIQEWQKENQFINKHNTENVKSERKMLEKEYVKAIVSLLENNIEQWEVKGIGLSIKIKNYEIEVSEYVSYSISNDYGIKVYVYAQDKCNLIFEYYTSRFSAERKAIKTAIRKANYIKDVNDMQKGNELLCKSFDELRGAI